MINESDEYTTRTETEKGGWFSSDKKKVYHLLSKDNSRTRNEGAILHSKALAEIKIIEEGMTNWPKELSKRQ
jgi:hypothetical protein